ncbi:transposase [Colletotrichum higginsianum]|nr:transposase [Colletotrichum higginsianum]
MLRCLVTDAAAESDSRLSELSISQILALTPLHQLQVPPLHWTKHHLRLLRCAFVDDQDITHPHSVYNYSADSQTIPDVATNTITFFPQTPPPPSTSATSVSPSSPPPPPPQIIESSDAHDENITPPDSDFDSDSNTDIDADASAQALKSFLSHRAPFHPHVRWARCLALSRVVAAKEGAMTSLLEKSPLQAKPARLFRERVAGTAFAMPSEPSPSILFLQASDIGRCRAASLRHLYLQRHSRDRKRLFDDHLGRIAADMDAFRDPYIAAALIAMAQARRKSIQSQARSPPPHQDTYSVRLLLSDINNPTCLRTFSAEIPDAFLDKLAYPQLSPLPSATFQIVHTPVAYVPYASFQSRLGQVLLPSRGQKRPRGGRYDQDTPDETMAEEGPNAQVRRLA